MTTVLFDTSVLLVVPWLNWATAESVDVTTLVDDTTEFETIAVLKEPAGVIVPAFQSPELLWTQED